MAHEHADTRSWDVDVLVVGGGPAGSTVGTLLRDSGHSVVVMDKDRHPRFHIGESLLPCNLPLFERLGVIDKLKEIGVDKRGAEFNDTQHSTPVLFNFAEGKRNDEPVAFQVQRAQFDLMLIENARDKGVDLLEGTRVTGVDFTPDGPVTAKAESDDGTHHTVTAKFVVDASGRDTFLSDRFKLKARNPKHNSAAVFGHFDDVPRLPGQSQGNISIYWFEHGWFWLIPLSEGRTSVGMVCWPKFMKTRQGSLEEFFWQGVALCEPLKARMANATLKSEITATGNFSYTSRALYGDRYILVGDAYAFIDPVFSSGVYLAMKSAEFAAAAVDGCLREPQRSAQHLKTYERTVKKGIKRFSWFIYRFTSPAMHHLFMNPTEKLNIRQAVTSVLAGDVYEPRWSMRLPLVLFRAVYRLQSLLLWRQGQVYRKRLEETL